MTTKIVPARMTDSGNYEPVSEIPEGVEYSFDITNRIYFYEEKGKSSKDDSKVEIVADTAKTTDATKAADTAKSTGASKSS